MHLCKALSSRAQEARNFRLRVHGAVGVVVSAPAPKSKILLSLSKQKQNRARPDNRQQQLSGLSPGPPACWAGVIPLHQLPLGRWGPNFLKLSCFFCFGGLDGFFWWTTLQSTTLPQSTAPVLLYYKVPLQYYSALQSNYYSSAALSYKVLLQHYKVLLQHYAEYYRVLLQYYPVLQSITPVLLCAPECYSSSVSRGAGTPALPRAGVPVLPRRSETFEMRLLMCKTQQLTVPEPDAQQSIAAPPGRAQNRDRDLPLTERNRSART